MNSAKLDPKAICGCSGTPPITADPSSISCTFGSCSGPTSMFIDVSRSIASSVFIGFSTTMTLLIYKL